MWGSLRSWSLEEEDLKLLDTNFREQKGPPCTSEEVLQLRRLQRGGYLPDGSFLSYSSGRWTLDGKWIQLPYRGLSKLLKRKKGMKGIDWRTMLYSIDWAVRTTSTYYPGKAPTTMETESLIQFMIACSHGEETALARSKECSVDLSTES